MPTNIQSLKLAIEEWLIRNQIDKDTLSYEISDVVTVENFT
ncbi:hypothetical protein B5T_01240 [Alloalcanivorax dieselolei B5]|uniref:Uncharacterized protein n=1 Tax=Alcanivorax dieselolei (strain DSM 16502 / CGMCC 1.3690 / MCCC 1A00001 / B-5) TaxID=930169 RepID=K0CA68_ALCDB|nr:hypothetical protein B5T_01240 [Alloalcanivorax dieselolei B5]